jgi:nicotinate dehydrogenase subunit A
LDQASTGGAGAGRLRLLVNGTEHLVDCSPDTPLLYVLRNDLGLLGTRFGCGLGLCGACNVLVDGRPVHSCDTPVSFVEGQPVTTVEGLSDGDSLHPVQQAFVDYQAFQCGYCSSGIVITAAALLARQPDADESQVRAALDGNLCRCGAHLRILGAIRSLLASPNGASN